MKITDMQQEMENTDKELEELLKGKAPAEEKPKESDELQENTDDSGEGKTAIEKPIEAPVTETPAQEVTPGIVTESTASAVDYKSMYESLKADFDKLTHAHAVLQGKTYAEVPRVNAENKALKETNSSLQGQLAEKDRVIADLQVKLENASTKKTEVISTTAAIDNLRDQHGDELADAMVELVKPFETKMQEATNTINALQSKITELEKGNTARTQTDHGTPTSKTEDPAERFYVGVFEAVPDWLDINGDTSAGKAGDPRFYNFLDTVEPNSKMTYRQLALAHQDSGNVEGFTKVFKDFKRTVAPAVVNIPAPEKGFSKEVEKHIEPSTVGGKSTITDKPKTYSRKEVNEFYDTLMKKGWQGTGLTQAEVVARDNEYSRADVEGRVVG